MAVGIFQSIRQSSGEQRPGVGFAHVTLIGKNLSALPKTWSLIDSVAALDETLQTGLQLLLRVSYSTFPPPGPSTGKVLS